LDIDPSQRAKLTSKLRSISGISEASKRIFGPTAASSLKAPRADCYIIGNRSKLSAEISEDWLVTQSSTKRVIPARLQDALLVRSLSEDSAPTRTDLISDQARTEPLSGVDTVIVFDGPMAFIRWKSAFPNHNWLLVLDRTDNAASQAAEALDDILDRPSATPVPIAAGTIPAGVEFLAYTSAAEVR
jgi:hypothetical protein